VGLLRWKTINLVKEFYVKETISDVKFLHNETMYAVAQKKYIYVYDMNGVELHRVNDITRPYFLDYLPYHWLLVSIGPVGKLCYLDTSTGGLVSNTNICSSPAVRSPATSMAQNPYNAMVHVGHSRGIVTMWTPNSNTPQVSMLCHKGSVNNISIDNTGVYMVTSGVDGQVKVWDIRTFKPLHSYSPRTRSGCPSAIAISQRGSVAIGAGPRITVYQNGLAVKADVPYLDNLFPGSIVSDAMFCPYEDFLGVTHSNGFFSMVVPGAGEPNFDTFEANPFQNLKQRREAEVHNLLEKIPHTMIALEPNFVGNTATTDKERQEITKAKLRVAQSLDKPLSLRQARKMAKQKKVTKKLKNDPRARPTLATKRTTTETEDSEVKEPPSKKSRTARGKQQEEVDLTSEQTNALTLFGLDTKPRWLT